MTPYFVWNLRTTRSKCFDTIAKSQVRPNGALKLPVTSTSSFDNVIVESFTTSKKTEGMPSYPSPEKAKTGKK